MIKTKYYTDLEIPIYNFFKLVDGGGFKFLIKKRGLISGNPEKIWEDLFSEYISKANIAQADGVLSLMKRYYGLQTRISVVDEVVGSLRQKHNEELVGILRSLGFRYKYDPYSDSYKKELNLTISRAKTWLVELEKTGKSLEKIKRSSERSVKSGIEKALVGLGNFLGRRIDPKTETMAEYIELVKTYESAIKDGERRQNKRYNRR